MIAPMTASALNTLDHHSGSATVLLTAALVLVTAYYAWTNRRVVQEMKAARDATLLPKLALDFHRLGPNVVDLAIRNVGPGAALDIEVEVEWVPVDASTNAPTIPWRRNLMSPGEQVELAPPGELNGNLDVLPGAYRDIRLRGTMKDAAGKRYVVNEIFGDITGWRELLKDANELWHPPEPERRAADALSHEFKPALTEMARALKEGVTVLSASRRG
jgi:hypothetical protein